MPREISCTVGAELAGGMRLDRYVAEVLGLCSRSQVKARLEAAAVNGSPVKISRILEQGDRLVLSFSPSEPTDLEPEDLSLSILYEDERVVVVDKAQGMVVHPGAGNRLGTLAAALLFRRMTRGGAGEGIRPGIVHRLDKDTSGVLIAAYDDGAHAYLAEQFKSRSTRKTYIAVVRGTPPKESGRVETLIGRDPKNRKLFSAHVQQGKSALTLYRILHRCGRYTVVLLRPKTGRTHQLRVHMKYLGCPILGDPLYAPIESGRPKLSLMLHALRLSIRLPADGGLRTFTAPIPARFSEFVELSSFHQWKGGSPHS